MSYDLKPRNKSVKGISMGLFTWPLYLQETGMGYILGYGEGKNPATYVYNTGNHGSPVSNDGYRVSASEAKAMAMVARGFVSVNRFIEKQWEDVPENEREFLKSQKTFELGRPIYRTAWHEDRLKSIEEFAEFAEKSGGFRIT